MGDLYKVSSTDRVLTLEKELVRDINELKNEIDDNERVYGIPPKPVSTVPMPKDVTHFRRERKLVLDRAMQVTEAHPIVIQADIMLEEMATCEKLEYTADSLPLLLHQYFVDRMHQLVQSKHMHMLRWKRFCQNTNVIENMYTAYQDRLNLINAEYDDCLERARRLAAVREAYLSESDAGQMAVTVDDVIIYMRALVCHYHAEKRVMQFMRILEWFSVIHKLDVSCSLPEAATNAPADDRSTSSARQSARPTPVVQERPKPEPVSGSRKPSSHIPPPPNAAAGQFVSGTTPQPSSLHYAAAAAGGGLAADESSQAPPLNFTDLESLRPQLDHLIHVYGVQGDVSSIRSSGDELELFAAVNKKFKSIFTRQQTLNTFPTYDKIEAGMETWGMDHSSHALKREANWLKFVRLKPEKDPYYERHFTLLRQKDNIDKLLQACARFIHVKDPERVQETLRDHAATVRRPPPVNAASVTSNRTPTHTMILWKQIYSNPELYKDNVTGQTTYAEFDEREADQVNLTSKTRSGSARKRRDSYDYSTTVQMLGLDDNDQGQSDPAASMQGAYLSYLHLRFLRIRDQQRTCLSLLNYFRSIERTLTINEAGLSQDSGKLKASSIQTMKRTMNDSGPGCVLGSHQYLHNTPADYKVSETEFMQFSDLENHDDFYSLDEGRVHVQDQRGYYVMYDVAMKDLEKLEKDLLLLATHYVEKDKDLRTATRIPRSATSSRRSQAHQAGDLDIPSYAHQEVDRYGILMDLWTCEAAFMDAKKNLLDCYYEAYQHVFDPQERRSIAQLITNLIHLRPRFDMDAQYFLKVYRMESINLRLQTQIIKKIMDNQILEEREYISTITRDTGNDEFGLPYPVIRKQPISINMSSHDDDTVARPSLRNVFLLEFHPSLSTASRIHGALKYAYWQLYHIHKPETVTESIHLETEMLELALVEWDSMDDIGKSFAQQVYKDVFGENYIEEPKFVVNLALELLENASDDLKRKSQKDRHKDEIKILAQVLEMLNLRSRLLDLSWQSEILSKLYRKQAVDLGFEECHLFLRFVQFEYAAHKENAGKPPPLFITAVQEDDTSIDKFVPSCLYLAINELDESNVGKFSFRSKEGIVKFASTGGLQTLQTIVQAQVVHKNALVSAVQLGATALKVKPTIMDLKVSEHKGSSGRQSPSDTRSEKSSLTATTAYSSATGVPGFGPRLGTGGAVLTQAEAFVSLQLEKTPSRDLMLNEFVKKKKEKGMILKNPVEMENLKRTMIQEYNHRMNARMFQYSLRGQLAALYESMLSVMEQFPNIRDNYFMLGEPNEKKSATDSEKNLAPDPTSFRRRPRRVLSADGRHVLNIWFIPHFTEILVMFKSFEDVDCNRALKYCVQIVAALHDILHYLCAHAQLGSAKARLGSNQPELVAADWGGTEGIGVELREIQKQIDHLSDPGSPQQVAEFLRLRRDVMFLEFETSVRLSMCNTFLAMGNVEAYQTTADNMHHALPQISNRRHPGHLSYLMSIPDPLQPWDFRAKELFPWRSYAASHGMFPVAFWPWQMIEYYMRLCLAGLKDVDQHTAQGEILGVSLLMEDVLGTDSANQANSPQPTRPQESRDGSRDEEAESGDESRTPSRASGSSRMSRASSVAAMAEGLFKLVSRRKPISRTWEATEAYRLIKSFLLLWKRLEFFKNNWGCRRLDVEQIDTVVAYKEFQYLYKTEKYFPVVRSIAARHGFPDFYDGIAHDAEHLPIAPGVSEMEIRGEQLVKLCESFEVTMVLEIKKKINKELNLVMTERAREESALPTDLWKKPAIKESYTINRPHHYENFHKKLMSGASENDQGFVIGKQHLNECLQQLSTDIMARERHNYESYSMFYENLLRVNHQQLYQKEQEIKQVRDQLKTSQHDTLVDVQAQLADQSHDLLMEVTALRAKVAEMRDISLTQERDVRMKVKDEYDGLIRSLFSSSFELKTRFDEFRMELHGDIRERISEARQLAIDKMNKIKLKSGGAQVEDELSQKHKALNERIKQMKQENLILNRLLTKMKSFTAWKQKNTEEHYLKQIAELRDEADTCKKDYLEIKMLAEEEVILLRQQLFALRRYLEAMEKDSNVVKKQLDKELKTKKDKLHAAAQKAQSQKQLEMAKQANAERLLEELEEKDIRLKIMEEERDKQNRLATIAEDKARKDVDLVRKRLAHERSLKLDAFERVDELQHLVYDAALQSTMAVVPLYSSRPKTTSSVQKRSNRASSAAWPPPVQWPTNRAQTPLSPAAPGYRSTDGKIQRPKTVDGRLRSRVSDQLLSNIGGRSQVVRVQPIKL